MVCTTVNYPLLCPYRELYAPTCLLVQDNIRRNTKNASSSDVDSNKVTLPKPETLDFELPSYWNQLGDSVASSSGSNLRSFFTGMGFLPSLVDKVIEENGEDNVDLLLETLIELSDRQKSNAQSSDSLESLFDENCASGPSEFSTYTLIQPKEEEDVLDAVDHEKRATLLQMNFTANEVEFAMDKFGANAPISEIVDFIVAAQIAEKLDRETDDIPNTVLQKNEDSNNETLFGTMEKTLRLLELGFSENEVSLAIERFGPEVPISELADWICGYQVGDDYIKEEKYSADDFSMSSHVAVDHRSFNMGMENDPRLGPYGSIKIKTEDFSQGVVSQSRNTVVCETRKGKRPKQDCIQDYSYAYHSDIGFEEDYKGKRTKPEYADDSNSFIDRLWVEEKVDPEIASFGMLNAIKTNSCKTLDRMVAKPPYFFYGNVATKSPSTWGKISQFLYTIEPEFVNAQFFSALNRDEGYIHNIPTENRFPILPKPAMTIEEVMPHTEKWWPSWDTRKQLSCINFETNGVSQLCDRLGRMLVDARGLLSSEQQRNILHHCRTLNLTWVGPNKLAPMEPQHLEHILGYPLNHTQAAESSLTERLHSLRYGFQIDTLGYHLSVLKTLFPGGMTVLSIFTGIGGAEIALHRLGIHLKGVVSVETSVTKRNILKRWWHSSGQTGQLEQLEDIQKLTSNKIDKLVERFGSFDFIICQNSFTDSSKKPKIGSHGDSPTVFDFTLFYEFVRVLQRVRSKSGRKE